MRLVANAISGRPTPILPAHKPSRTSFALSASTETDYLYGKSLEEIKEAAASHLYYAIDLFLEVIPSSQARGRGFKTLAEAADSWND
jgi:hypothetical protein